MQDTSMMLICFLENAHRLDLICSMMLICFDREALVQESSKSMLLICFDLEAPVQESSESAANLGSSLEIAAKALRLDPRTAIVGPDVLRCEFGHGQQDSLSWV